MLGLVKPAIRVPVQEEEVVFTGLNGDSLSNVDCKIGFVVDSTVPSIDRM